MTSALYLGYSVYCQQIPISSVPSLRKSDVHHIMHWDKGSNNAYDDYLDDDGDGNDDDVIKDYGDGGGKLIFIITHAQKAST